MQKAISNANATAVMAQQLRRSRERAGLTARQLAAKIWSTPNLETPEAVLRFIERVEANQITEDDLYSDFAHVISSARHLRWEL